MENNSGPVQTTLEAFIRNLKQIAPVSPFDEETLRFVFLAGAAMVAVELTEHSSGPFELMATLTTLVGEIQYLRDEGVAAHASGLHQIH